MFTNQQGRPLYLLLRDSNKLDNIFNVCTEVHTSKRRSCDDNFYGKKYQLPNPQLR